MDHNLKTLMNCAEIRRGYDIAAPNRIWAATDLDVAHIQGGPRPGDGAFNFARMILNRADSAREILWLNFDRLLVPQRSTGQRAGNDCANAMQGKPAVDEQARFADVARRREPRELRGDGSF